MGRLRRTMRLRWVGLLLGVALLALVLPGRASANSLPFSLSTQSVPKNDGFKLKLSATQGQSTASDTVDAILHKSTEGASYVFDVAFTAMPDLSSAHISGTFALSRGSIDMAFHATKAATKVPVDKGCTGTPGKQRTGVLKGKLTLKADKLGTEKLSKVGATLISPPHVTSCKPRPPLRGAFLFGARSASGYGLSLSVNKVNKHPVSESLTIGRSGPGYTFIYSAFAQRLPDSDYAFASDLSTAKVIGAGPLHGKAKYTGTPAVHGVSTGTLDGNLKVVFATIGTVKPFAHGALQASQSRSQD